RRERPGRQRAVGGVVLALRAHVEAQLAPGDELVEERLRRGAHPPEPLALPAARCAEELRRPALRARDGAEDLVRRDVAEVEPGREPARTVEVGVVAVLGVAREALRDERGEAGARRGAPAPERRRRHRVVDGERRERRGIAREERRRRGGPAREEVPGERGRGGERGAAERVRGGEGREVL